MRVSMTKSSSKRVSLLLVTACSVAFLFAMAADFGARVLQEEEGEGSPEASEDLVGHWRFTKIIFAHPETNTSSSVPMEPPRTGS